MPTYVALGSSFASGPGIDPIVCPPCGRSGRNYPRLVAERLGLDLADVTSGGATVDDVLTSSQALMAGGTVPPQIGAVGADADLVTVTVGGNDVEYLLTLLRCSYEPTRTARPAARGSSSRPRSTGPPSRRRSPPCPGGWPGWSTSSAPGRRTRGSCSSTT